MGKKGLSPSGGYATGRELHVFERCHQHPRNREGCSDAQCCLRCWVQRADICEDVDHVMLRITCAVLSPARINRRAIFSASDAGISFENFPPEYETRQLRRESAVGIITAFNAVLSLHMPDTEPSRDHCRKCNGSFRPVRFLYTARNGIVHCRCRYTMCTPQSMRCL